MANRNHTYVAYVLKPGVTADLDSLSKSARLGPPFAGLDPPPNFPFLASFVSYLVTNSICKLFEKNQPFHSNSAAFIIASRTEYARIRCEQTTAFEPLKFLQ